MTEDEMTYVRVADMWHCKECKETMVGRPQALKHHTLNHVLPALKEKLVQKIRVGILGKDEKPLRKSQTSETPDEDPR